MDIIFQIVAGFLSILGDFTGLSYKAANIVVYYIFIPFVYAFLLDKIMNRHYFKIGFSAFVLISLLIINDFEIFSERLFDYSVNFLMWFQHIGCDYVVSSVIIYVIIPLLVLIGLIYFAFRQKK